MASNLQAAGCCSSFTTVVLFAGVRGSPNSPHRLAKTTSPRNSLQGEDDYNLSNVDYDDVTSKWLSADFLNLRLRSNGLICKEAIQALRKHFKQMDEQQPVTPSEAVSSKSVRKVVERAPPSARQVNTRPLPNVIFYDETVHSQLYNSSSTYKTTFSFLDESFC
ncbi:uncharacterized protein [Physcomitrium patens]|uniref:uncharacterized protein isoform X3 n=1 Tax=Physcomitrium patens TaxID=3218 RepID=UPI00024AAEB7